MSLEMFPIIESFKHVKRFSDKATQKLQILACVSCCISIEKINSMTKTFLNSQFNHCPRVYSKFCELLIKIKNLVLITFMKNTIL